MQGKGEQRTEPYLEYGERAAASPNAAVRKIIKPQVIFFGNGLLADFALETLQNQVDIIFHARKPEDLAKVAELKRQHPEA